MFYLRWTESLDYYNGGPRIFQCYDGVTCWFSWVNWLSFPFVHNYQSQLSKHCLLVGNGENSAVIFLDGILLSMSVETCLTTLFLRPRNSLFILETAGGSVFTCLRNKACPQLNFFFFKLLCWASSFEGRNAVRTKNVELVLGRYGHNLVFLNIPGHILVDPCLPSSFTRANTGLPSNCGKPAMLRYVLFWVWISSYLFPSHGTAIQTL